ncbi:MAG TPA: WD40 repeat domain-containing protein [Anaerolineales bacterium]|jgi:WD40 repeat protein
MKLKAGFGIIAILLTALACNSATPRGEEPTAQGQLPVVDPTAETLAETVPPPSPTPLAPLGPDNLDQLQYLHGYWPAVAAAAKPYAGDEWDFEPQWVLSAAAYSPDGRFIALGGCTIGGYSGGESGRAWCADRDDPSDDATNRTLGFVLDAHTEEIIATLPEYPPDTTITDLAFTHDGATLLIATDPGKVEKWDVSARQIESVLWEASGYPQIAISPDDRWVALNDYETLKILELSSGEIVKELPEGYENLGPPPLFSADGTRIASADAGGFRIFDTATWEEAAFFDYPCLDRCYVEFSPDLSLAASWELDSAAILIWDVTSGQQLRSLDMAPDEILSMKFNPDGSLLSFVTADNIAKFWGTDDWQPAGDYALDAIVLAGIRGHFILYADDGRSFLCPSAMGIELYGLP